jgi:hypothetical protein
MAQPQVDFVSDIQLRSRNGASSRQTIGAASPRAATLSIWLRPARPWAKHRALSIISMTATPRNVGAKVFEEPTRVLLAHSWEGNPIPREHGGPVREIIPDWYFGKSPEMGIT